MNEHEVQILEQIVNFNIERNIKSLFKDILKTIETLKSDNDEALYKLMESLPDEHKGKVVLAEFMTKERCNRIRKDILDRGNDCIRNIREQLSQVKITTK